jgi:hypothetical protein
MVARADEDVPVASIRIELIDPYAMELWRAVAKVATALGRDRDDQRHDLVTLLSLLDDPRAARIEITTKEIGWVRSISDRLAIDDPSFQESFEATRLRAARAAYRVLAA